MTDPYIKSKATVIKLYPLSAACCHVPGQPANFASYHNLREYGLRRVLHRSSNLLPAKHAPPPRRELVQLNLKADCPPPPYIHRFPSSLLPTPAAFRPVHHGSYRQ